VTDQTTNQNPNDETAAATLRLARILRWRLPRTRAAIRCRRSGRAESRPGRRRQQGQKRTPADDAALALPRKYDTAAFKMPEGVEFDARRFRGRRAGVARTEPHAGPGRQAHVRLRREDRPADRQAHDRCSSTRRAAELRANLARDLQADPEVGGKKLEESRSFAAKAIAHFIPKAAERSSSPTFLNESGLGNHPLLMRLVAGAGRAMAEASTLAAEKEAAPNPTPKFSTERRGNESWQSSARRCTPLPT
jgi:hypothetical protein